MCPFFYPSLSLFATKPSISARSASTRACVLCIAVNVELPDRGSRTTGCTSFPTVPLRPYAFAPGPTGSGMRDKGKLLPPAAVGDTDAADGGGGGGGAAMAGVATAAAAAVAAAAAAAALLQLL